MPETEGELIHRAFREVQMAEAREFLAMIRARRAEILRRQRAELSATIRASFHLVQAQEILASIADGSFHE